MLRRLLVRTLRGASWLNEHGLLAGPVIRSVGVDYQHGAGAIACEPVPLALALAQLPVFESWLLAVQPHRGKNAVACVSARLPKADWQIEFRRLGVALLTADG